MKKTSNTKDQVAIIQIENSSGKVAETIYQALIPEINTSNLVDFHVKVQKIGPLLIFYFKSNNTATLRAIINSYLRWVNTINQSLAVINLKNSTSISISK